VVTQDRGARSGLKKPGEAGTHEVTEYPTVDGPKADRVETQCADRNASAQNSLGQMLVIGRGLAQSDEEAARWCRKAADQGHAEAQNSLGYKFFEGRGVAQSDTEAARWCRKAADQGGAEAQNSLGHMFSLGRGLAQSDVEAARWFRKAADQGNASAQNSLGQMKRERSTPSGSDLPLALAWRRTTRRRRGGFARQLTKGTRTRRAHSRRRRAH
jgi:hypothetical protein